MLDTANGDSVEYTRERGLVLASRFVDAPWDEELTRSIATAIAVAKGHILLADIVMDLRPETIEAYYQWKGWKYHQQYLHARNRSADSDA
jgi:hypothetical protein